MDDDAVVVQQGWLELSSQSSKKGGKGWLNRVSKQWKKLFFILYKQGADNEEVVLSGFEKSENVRYTSAKKTMTLTPRYKIAKKLDFKNKEFVIEVNNENNNEIWFLAADSQKTLDLWSIQLQMQTRLSRSISGRIFSVIGAGTKPLQRIGGRDQQCLLYFTQWGLTLALQQSRAILAMWPLSTIRNYECTGTGQFCIESGRRSPMGTGKYVFFTGKGEDELMFNVIDVFVNARLNANAEIGCAEAERREATDDELLATYDKLHSCALGILPLDVASGYGTLNRGTHSEPRTVISDRPPPYSRLDHYTANPDHVDSVSPLPLATPDFSTVMGPDKGGTMPRTDSFNSPDTAYDQLDRTQSWGSKSQVSTYDHIERSAGYQTEDSYDHIERKQTLPNSSGKPSSDSPSAISSSGAPSIPLRSSTPENLYVDHPQSKTNDALSSDTPSCYPNAIYAPHLPINQSRMKEMKRDKPAVSGSVAIGPYVTDNYENANPSFGEIEEDQFPKSYENLNRLAGLQNNKDDDVIGLIDNMIKETHMK